MLEKLSKPLSVAKDKNLHLYCGEFGCYKSAGKRDMQYRDFISILRNRAYPMQLGLQSDFGILDQCRKETNIAGMKLC